MSVVCVSDAQLPREYMLQVRVAHYREGRANCLLSACLRLSCSEHACCRCGWHIFGRASPSRRPPSWRSIPAGLTSWLSFLSSPHASTGKWQAGAAHSGWAHQLAPFPEQPSCIFRQLAGRCCLAVWDKHMQPDSSMPGCAACLQSTAWILIYFLLFPPLQHNLKTACPHCCRQGGGMRVLQCVMQ